MAEAYADPPLNIEEITPYVITKRSKIVREILQKDKCYFYDTCSFRRHANLRTEEAAYFWKYIKNQNGIIVITGSILMELGSRSGVLNREYIEYIEQMHCFGLSVLILREEDLFFVVDACFHTNAVINSYLCWAVRMLRGPVSTITETLQQEPEIADEVIKGKNLERGTVYPHFFEAVRARKETGDNLGEEMLALCLHILSHLPGEVDGKFCILTDDRGAAGKIDALFRKTAGQYRGKAIVILSTPKLLQVLYQEGILVDPGVIESVLSAGTDGNISVLGNRMFDLRSQMISQSCGELARLITQPNGIYIIF